MDRLTYRDKDGMAMMKERGGWKSGGIDRLAAYEDSGLEPEEIIGLKNTCEQLIGINDSLFKANQEMGKDLAEWKKAHDDGRLVVLPCKVGVTVYVIGESCDFCETYLDEPERCMRCEKGHYVEERGFELWMLSELNESIFLTREKAEVAMKEANHA